MRGMIAAWLFTALPGLAADAPPIPSLCHGTVAQGRLTHGVRLPPSGPNFTAYSALGVALGRTHVHGGVAQIVLQAYRALAHSAPGVMFVYGETGWARGGRFWPHRTHQNGLSVDFMVPVRSLRGESLVLPAWAGNGFGYGMDFDAQARHGRLGIDFEAVAEHLYQLDRAARAQGAGLARVIFDTDYLPQLWATRRGAYLRAHLPFMRGRPWVRHDDHYHVDFALACRPRTG